eukprot:PITA_07803
MVDRLSALPDSLLSLILCKLPIRDAIRCSVLSTRWRFLYTEMPQLLLTPAGLLATDRQDAPLSMAALENIISHILRLHSSDLDTFLVCTGDLDPWNPILSGEFDPWNPILLGEFRRQTLWEWLQCVARKNVQRLFLRCSYMEIPPPTLFSCTRLTTLTLFHYILTDFPTDFVGFNLLTKCTLYSIRMTDDSLARFLSLCPLLRNFNLKHCTGLQTPVISAISITYLILYRCGGARWTVNCPKLKTLKTFTVQDLKVSGMGFHQLSPTIESLEMELGNNLTALSLRSTWYPHTLSAKRFLEIVGTLTSLKAVTINDEPDFLLINTDVVPLFNLLSRLPNLERFHLLIPDSPERDPIPLSSMSPLPNLQLVEMQINECDERELHLLGCLLQIAPALKEVKLKPALNCNNELYRLFLEKWQSLKQGREQGNVTEETICEFSFRF